MIEFLSAPAPLWAALLLIALAGAAGWWWGRSFVPAEQPATVRAEKFATGRVAVQQPATEALTRVLAAPGEVAGSDLPPRGILDVTAVAADFLPPVLVETAAQDAQAVLDQTVPRLDLDSAHDVFGTDDLDELEEPDDEQEPPRAGAPAAAFQAAILPRCDWSLGRAEPWPAGKGVTPDRWSMYRWRAGRWITRVRTVWSQLRAYLAERQEARGWDRSPGWAPGEATRVMTGEQPAVEPAPVPPPLSRPAQHQPGYRKVWSAVLVDGFRATGTAGRHRFGVAAGALAQRQGRLLALPAGAP